MNPDICLDSQEPAKAQGAVKPSPKWGERLRALRNNTPLMIKMVWEASPGIVVAGFAARLIASLIPLATLAVGKLIIDGIDGFTAHHKALPTHFWWLVVLEFILAALATVLVRALDFFDTVLADKFTRYVSTKVVEHASRLDLTSYEDPIFYDKMDRARVQSTDRLIMIQSAGRLFQQSVPLRRPSFSAPLF